MSRIAGVAAGTAATVTAMLGACRSGAVAGGWDEAVAPGTGATVGWTGRGPAAIHESDDLACVVDGAIYNLAELGVAGHDAEVVAELYRRHGLEAALRRLNGDFAIALHDRTTGTLWLARDRFGVRPLYHAAAADGFAFASRPRALLGLPGVGREPDREYVALVAGSHYRYFDNRPGRSPFAAVAQVPQAHLVEVRDGRTPQMRRWWGLGDAPDLDDSEEDLAERYRELLLDAVGIRLARAGRPAFTLSGGMDSSSVLASAAHIAGCPQPAWSTVYSNSDYDESGEIRDMLEAAVEQWHPVRVDAPDVLALVERMVAAHDEPVATATWLAHWVLAGAVADSGATTLFGGLGGDELNAGEYEYFLYRFADLRAAGAEDELAREVEAWARHHDHPVFRKNAEVMEAGLARLTDPASRRILPDRARLERYVDAVDPEWFDLRGFEPEMDHPFASYLKNRTYQDLFRETAPCCLRAEDRHTSAMGIRNCDPFFDHRLAELMFRVPGAMKIRDGITKRLLRQATRGLLPEPTRTRIKKTGWNAPADLWFAGSGRDLLHDLVDSEDFRAASVYRLDVVRRLIDEHDEIVSSGRAAENHMMFLWQLVNLELWLRSHETL